MIDPEIYFPIDGFDRYEVSDHGNVRKLREDGTVERYLCVSVCTKGYLQVRLWRGRKRYQPLVHQLVAEAFLGPPPDLLMSWDVHHKNTIRVHNWPGNLEWVPHKEHWRRGTRYSRQRAA